MSRTDRAGAVARYVFPPLERRGVVLGLRAGPLATVVAGALVGLGAVRALPGAAGIGAAVAVLVVAVGSACWPVGGQAPVSWLPTLAGWAERRSGGCRLVAEPLEGGVERADAPADRPLRRRPQPTAPPGIRLLAAPRPPGEPDLGVVEDLPARSWAAVIPVTGAPLGLLGPDDQERRLAAWGALLSGLGRSGGGVRRLQWVEMCGPADATPMRCGAQSAIGPAAPAYRAAVEAEAPGVTAHRGYLVLAVRAPGVRPLRPPDPAAQNDLLRREVRLLRTALRAADLDVGAALDLDGLFVLLRAGCAPNRPVPIPGAGPSPRRREVAGPALQRVAGSPWPAAIDERWSSVRVDAEWQVTYWIAEWPRLPVGPDMLSPLLLEGGARSVAVTMAPVPAARAVREVQSARTAALADEALRARAGFIDTVQRRREGEGVRQREAELAAGHADYRYSGYITVSAPTPAALEESCAAVEGAGQRSHLVLRRLHGRQAEARTWTLPIGRGLS